MTINISFSLKTLAQFISVFVLANCCCLFFNFTQFVILENLSILDLTLSGVKGFKVQHVYSVNSSDIATQIGSLVNSKNKKNKRAACSIYGHS